VGGGDPVDEVLAYVKNLVDSNQGTFLSKFILSLKEVEVPDAPRDNFGNITDSTFQVRYYKSHYFDYFDLSDVRLLRTPFYEKKLMNYLDNLVVPFPDTVYKEVDHLIQLSRADTFLFKYMLTTLFNYYANSKYLTMDAVYVYLAEKYYIPEAKWSDQKFIEDLKKRVVKIKPLLVGNPAPDVQLVRVSDEHFMIAAEDTSLKKNPYVGEFFKLRSVPAKFLLLYFWEADCGHCKKAIPELHAIYERLKSKGVQIIAVHMLSGIPGKEKWVDFISSNNLYGWINAWNPYDFSYRDIYDINSSNILYLFDKDKKILAKRISPEQAEQIILEELRKNK
jgi:thiol-disulfide isomerase/thioredoxin